MPGNYKKEDLRIVKTYKVLVAAMLTLLNRRNLGRITVNDLCEEALISRATFYAHFTDKYDLLKHYLTNLRKDIISHTDNYSEMEMTLNQFIRDHTKIITNLMEDADSETLELLHSFMLSIIDTFIVEKTNNQKNSYYIILSSFCTGGMINLLSWQVKNKFPKEAQLINPYVYEMLKSLMEWHANQE